MMRAGRLRQSCLGSMIHARLKSSPDRSARSVDSMNRHTSQLPRPPRQRRRTTITFVVLLLLVFADTAGRVHAGGGNANGNGNANANVNANGNGNANANANVNANGIVNANGNGNGNGPEPGLLVTTSQKTTAESGILALILITTGLLLCMAGRRWLRVTCAIVGWLTWAGSCWIAMANSEPDTPGFGSGRSAIYLAVPMSVGFMGAVLFVFFKMTALLLSGALAGMALSSALLSVREGGLLSGDGAQVAILVILGSTGLVLMLLYDRNIRNWPHILCTSVLGAYMIVLGLDQFIHAGISNMLANIFDRNVNHDQTRMAQYGVKGSLYALLVFETALTIAGYLFQTRIIPRIHPSKSSAEHEARAGEMTEPVVLSMCDDLDVDDGHLPEEFVDDLSVDLSPPHRHSAHSSWSSLRQPRLSRVEEHPQRPSPCTHSEITAESDCEADSDVTPPQPPYADDRVFEMSVESLGHYDSRRGSDSDASRRGSAGNNGEGSSSSVSNFKDVAWGQRGVAISPPLPAVTSASTRSKNVNANAKKKRNKHEHSLSSSLQSSLSSSLSSSSLSSSSPSSLPSTSLLARDDPRTTSSSTRDAQRTPFLQGGKVPDIVVRID